MKTWKSGRPPRRFLEVIDRFNGATSLKTWKRARVRPILAA